MKKQSYYIKILIAIFFIYSLVYYIPSILAGEVVRGDDFNWQYFFPFDVTKFFIESWNFNFILGSVTKLEPLKITNILRSVIPVFVSTNLFFFVLYSLLFISTYLFFRAWSVNKVIALIAATLVTFSPNFHTFIRTGHVAKIALTPFLMFAFAFITFFFKSDKNVKSFGTLTALSLTFALADGDPQVLLYFMPFFCGYVLWLMFSDHNKVGEELTFIDKHASTNNVKDLAPNKEGILSKAIKYFKANKKKNYLVFLIALLSIVFSIPAIHSWYGKYQGESDAVDLIRLELIPSASETPSSEIITEDVNLEKIKAEEHQNWLWATQWSLPPAEMLTFFVPHFFGTTSQSDTNPYWGKVGQTEGWEQHRQGYRNYSLMDNYLGVFVVLFVIYGFFYLPTRFRLASGILLLLFLFLSFGKFSFLYEWFYQLPLVKNFRNPNRFIQLIHFMVAIFLGFGLHHFYLAIKNQCLGEKNSIDRLKNSTYRFFKYLTISIFILGGIGIVGLLSEKKQLIAYFNNLFDYNVAKIIVDNMVFYWIKGMIVYVLASVLLQLFIIKVNKNNLVLWIGVLFGFALLDMYLVNIKYYQFEKPESKLNTNVERLFAGSVPGYEQFKVDPNAHIKPRYYFYRSPGDFRTQYGRYLYHNGSIGMPAFQFKLVRRDIPAEYKSYYSYLKNPDLRFLKLGSVNYFFSELFFQDPSLKLVFQDELQHLKESFYVYEMPDTIPYVDEKNNIEMGNDLNSILGRMNENSFDIYNSVMIHSKAIDFNLITEEQIRSVVPDPNNKITFKDTGSSEILVEADLVAPAILVLSAYYNKNMKAFSGEKELSHFPANYFYNGYYVTPEDKDIIIKYQPDYSVSIIYLAFVLNYIILIWIMYLFYKHHFIKTNAHKKKKSAH